MPSLLVMMSKRQIEFDIFAVCCYDELNRLDANRFSCITVNAVRFQTFLVDLAGACWIDLVKWCHQVC